MPRQLVSRMKKFLLALMCVGVASASAFAGDCGSCGGKDKSGDKPKDGTKQSLVSDVIR